MERVEYSRPRADVAMATAQARAAQPTVMRQNETEIRFLVNSTITAVIVKSGQFHALCETYSRRY